MEVIFLGCKHMLRGEMTYESQEHVYERGGGRQPRQKL